MATNLLNTSFVDQIIDTCNQIYKAGWAENHAGNLSYLLTEEEIDEYIGNGRKVISSSDLEVPCPSLRKKYFLVTAAGSPFKNIKKDPDKHLGIIQINDDGSGYDIIWGFRENKHPTSELPTHLLCHSERLQVDNQHRIVLHCHPDYTIAMTFIHGLDQKDFTKTMWSLNSECVLVFPEGLGVLPWMVCGNGEIGLETAIKMKEFRSVIWPHHGIIAAGQSVDQALGLIETIEKAARVYVVTDGKRKQCMTGEQIIALADAFSLSIREGIVTEKA